MGDTSQQVTEDSTPKDSFDQLVSEEKKEEPKPEEKKSSFGGSLFDSILNKAWTSKKEEPVVEEKKDESEEEDDNVETKSDDDDDIGNDESKDEPKDDTDDDGEKDTFDKMLSGESTSEPKAGDEDNDSESKTDTPTPAATTISEDALAEIEKEEKDDFITMFYSDKIPNDDKYYDDLKVEEKDWLEANPTSVDTVYGSNHGKVNCASCGKICDPIIGIKTGVVRHPALGLAMCDGCRKFYGDGDWNRTEDGDEYCRMCAQGGDILLCDNCPNAFCKMCISRNLGSKTLREINKSEEWSCFVCNPEPLYKFKAIYFCMYRNQAEFKARREEDKRKEKERKERSKSGKLAKQKEALVKSPQNFLEENISEAFKTLEVYQKSLEAERTRCIKAVKDGISVEVATSITRKLRKLYAVTQKNMDLLDRAIVESFVENYPTESTRIHMGRVAPAQPQYAPPVKRGAAKNKKKMKQKIKVKPKGKGKKAPAKGKKKGVIELNGAPDYVEYDLPKSV